MVERILDMIGRGVGIDQLFISTFTVKAAGELKSVWKAFDRAAGTGRDR